MKSRKTTSTSGKISAKKLAEMPKAEQELHKNWEAMMTKWGSVQSFSSRPVGTSLKRPKS